MNGVIIKDATPYNIQFVNGRPLFIDILSFERYDASKAWVAYRQFCNMFLFPLYLEHYLKADIQKTMVVYPDGIPVEITSRLLPLKSRTNIGVWLHVYLQNTVSRHARDSKDEEKFNKKKLLNLVHHLEETVQNLKGRGEGAGWRNYYSETITGNNYLAHKETIFNEMMGSITASTVLDIGANDGHFAKMMANMGKQVIAIDNDSRTVSDLYQARHENILPLVIDAGNPSPATGFNNKERPAFHQRIKTDAVVALALIHHLVIGRNLPLALLADWFSGFSSQLVIEFVPREDDKVKRMLASRKDIFEDYTPEQFEKIFSNYFSIIRKAIIPGTARAIYLMEKR